MPIVSVITVVKNHSIGLKATVESLQNQTFLDWELIIVVAPSTDDSLDFARSVANNDVNIHVIHQNGLGIYPAMNEGIRKSVGKYLWFMNAGDRFASSNVLDKAILEITDLSVSLIIGAHSINGKNPKRFNFRKPRELSLIGFAFNRRGGCHQAMIFQSSITKELNGFNEKFSLAADFDLVLRILKRGTGKRVRDTFADIEPGGQADQNLNVVYHEKHIIRCQNLKGALIKYLSIIWTVLARTKIFVKQFLRGDSNQ